MALPDAEVSATEIDTGAVRAEEADGSGRFLFSEINPGTYTVTVRAKGFATQTSQPVAVGVGHTVSLTVNLALSAAVQTVEVNAQQALLSLENPNTSTTLEAKTIAKLPNPGQDLTFIAQFAPGALMNTAGSSNDAKAAGGYGNVEFNGLPATSNGYILDGYDTNDPWLGLNIGLSTNLVIGLDAVDQATVNTNSYSVDQGRYGASQVNYFTKSGTNQFHGDMYEIWNGAVFNAEDYFLHANDTPGNVAQKPRSNVNEFGVSLGGPIRPNKLFFFAHYEGVRIALPIETQTVAPSPAYQQYVLQQLPLGGTDPMTGTALTAEPEEVPFYESMFRLYRSTAGTPVPVSSCPLDASGTVLAGTQTSGNLFDGSGCANQRQVTLTNDDNENLIVVKIDHTINANNTVWYRFQQDTGLQAAYTDPINAIFNSYSPQPQRTLVVGYTHVFRSNLVNQFNPGASWYSSIFEPENYAQVRADLSHRFDGGQQRRAVHDHRRQRQHLSAGAQGDAMAGERQPGLDAGEAILPVRHQFAADRCERLRPGRGNRAHRGLQRSGGIHLRRGLHRKHDLSCLAQGAGGRGQSRPLRDGYLETDLARHAHGRIAGHMEHRSRESAAAVCAPGGIVSRSPAQREPAARPGD